MDEIETARRDDTGDRIGDWMITATGVRFFPRDPRPEDIRIADIAHHLARICRYGGAVEDYYSVAEHSCLMADHFLGRKDIQLARWALLHDAAEAYIGDLIRPIKPALPDFKAIEGPLERMVWLRYGLGPDLPRSIKEADAAIVGDERFSLFPAAVLAAAQWSPRSGLGILPQGWERGRAAWEFRVRFAQLFPEVGA